MEVNVSVHILLWILETKYQMSFQTGPHSWRELQVPWVTPGLLKISLTSFRDAHPSGHQSTKLTEVTPGKEFINSRSNKAEISMFKM